MKKTTVFDWKAPVFGLLCAVLLNTVGLWSGLFHRLIQNYQAPQWAMVVSQMVSQWSRGMWLAFFPAAVALWMLYSRREGRGILIYLEGIFFLLLFAVLLEKIVSGLMEIPGIYFHQGFFYYETAFISLCPVWGAALLLLPDKAMGSWGKGILWILGGAGGLLYGLWPRISGFLQEGSLAFRVESFWYCGLGALLMLAMLFFTAFCRRPLWELVCASLGWLVIAFLLSRLGEGGAKVLENNLLWLPGMLFLGLAGLLWQRRKKIWAVGVFLLGLLAFSVMPLCAALMYKEITPAFLVSGAYLWFPALFGVCALPLVFLAEK